MTTTVIRRALVAALCLLRVAPSVLAFAPPDAASSFTTQYVSNFRHRLLAQRPIPSPAARRSLPVARAADSPEPPSPSPSIALPATYAAAAAGLVYRALQSTDRVEAAVLFSTAALALVNFGPIDRSLLTSADLADGLNPPAIAGEAKRLRQAAKTWGKVVRIKIFGQLAGIGRMILSPSSLSMLRGAAMVMAANAAFFLCGAGASRHDDKGKLSPLPPGVVRSVMTLDTALAASALVAASAPVGSSRRAIAGGIYAVGVCVGALEGLANLVKS